MLRRARAIACAVIASLLATAAVVAGVTIGTTPAAAADPSEFRPGSIISDALFFDGGAMSAGDVQAFLVSKGTACTAGALCLKNYSAPTTAQPAEAGLCAGYAGGGTESAAQIIAKVGASCGISQKALLVTLQKEQGLVTATSPTDSRYKIAMGFGCPDTAPCDTQYYGFFNQVYKAARQFKRYAAAPQNYGYRAGRVNTILFNPNGACGSTQVFIENQATAGLYTYTPYQPNASALANLYGSGDSCGAYGNRNFWRDYTDWFGSTQVGSNLVRAAGNPTVYVVTTDSKFPVADMTTLSSLAPLGALGTVQQSFLDARTTGATLGRFIRDRAGLIYFFDRGVRYLVTDCAQLAAWGASCSDYLSMTLSDVQIASFPLGGTITQNVRTPGGKRFAIYDGAKHEVADDLSAVGSAPASTPTFPVSEEALAGLPYGAPLVRAGVIARDRSTGADVLVDTASTVSLGAGVEAGTRVGSLPVVSLDHASIALLPAPTGTLTGVFKGTGGAAYGLTSGPVVKLGAGQLSPLTASAPTLSPTVVAALGAATTGTVFVGATGSPTLYLAVDGLRRPVPSMDVLWSMQDPAGALVVRVSAAELATVPTGVEVLKPGTLVQASGAAQIYLVDGPRTLHKVTSFGITDTIGVSGWRAVDPAIVAGYQVAANPLSSILVCGSERFVGSGGRVVPVPTALVDASGAPVSTLDATTCRQLARGAAAAPAALFVAAPGQPTIYVASGTKKRPVPSMATLYAVTSGAAPLVAQVPQASLDGMPLGTPVLAPGTLVKRSDSPTISLVDGLGSLVSLPSFAISDALGLTTFTTVAPEAVAGYTTAAAPLGSAVSCGTWRAIGSGGKLYPVSASVFDASGVPTTVLDPATCAAMPRVATTASGPVFLKAPSSPTIYLARGGQKLPVATMDRAWALAAGQPFLVATLSDETVAAMPTGPAA